MTDEVASIPRNDDPGKISQFMNKKGEFTTKSMYQRLGNYVSGAKDQVFL